MKYAEVILPLALEKTYTFGIPLELQSKIQVGSRVEVQFGKKKMYSGIVKRLHNEAPDTFQVKPIRSILDAQALVNETQLKFWEWISTYYMCSEGEVMQAALPAYLKLQSETYVSLTDEFNINELELTDEEYIVLQALQIRAARNKKSDKSGSEEKSEPETSGVS